MFLIFSILQSVEIANPEVVLSLRLLFVRSNNKEDRVLDFFSSRPNWDQRPPPPPQPPPRRAGGPPPGVGGGGGGPGGGGGGGGGQ